MEKYIANKDRYREMVYRQSGESGLKLPVLSLGLWHNFGGVDNEDTARLMLRRPLIPALHILILLTITDLPMVLLNQLLVDAWQQIFNLIGMNLLSPPKQDMICGMDLTGTEEVKNTLLPALIKV